jgi:hypothetical protein
MRSTTLMLFAAQTFVAALMIAVPLSAQNQKITTFEAPSAGTSSFQGTFPQTVNPSGAIAGSYTDASSTSHGFVRAKDGTITTIDVAGSTGTSVASINPEGDIAGNYNDSNYVSHGFLRAADGDITTFDAPGAGTGQGQGTTASSINAAGAIAGYYTDASYRLMPSCAPRMAPSPTLAPKARPIPRLRA